MPRGDKSSYTDKQKRRAEHIEDGYEKRGVGKKEAARRAWATVNQESGGGKKSGSGRGKAENRSASKTGGRKGGAAAAARPKAAKKKAAKKAAASRKKSTARKTAVRKKSCQEGRRYPQTAQPLIQSGEHVFQALTRIT